MYEYMVRYVSNYDGDTIRFVADLGFGVSFNIQVRLSDVDTYELRSKDANLKALAYEAKEHVAAKLSSANNILIKTEKDKTGKYGRYLATVFYDGINLNQELLDLGLATNY
jgi:micrococcal nuclease